MVASALHRGIEDALRDAAPAYRSADIDVRADLRASTAATTHDDLLYQAVYTLFRGLPGRLAPGARLRIATQDRAGGDVELTWEASERHDAHDDAGPREALGVGPYGDLFDLALFGLESLCRARGARMLRHGETPEGRFSFLIPALERAPGGYTPRP